MVGSRLVMQHWREAFQHTKGKGSSRVGCRAKGKPAVVLFTCFGSVGCFDLSISLLQHNSGNLSSTQ